MTTIRNDTEKTVEIFNDKFMTKLCANEQIEVGEEELHGDYKLYFCFPDLKEMKRKVEYRFEKGWIRKRTHYKYEHQFHFPVATVLNIQNVSEVTLKAEDVSLRDLLLFKTVHFSKILCECTPSESGEKTFAFLNEEDKRHFLKLMRWGCAITFPFACMAALIFLGLPFTDYTIMEKIVVSLLLLGFIVVASTDFYYTLKARSWEVSQRTQWIG